MDIALIGGHGKIALLTEPLLVGAGHRVDAIIRDPGQTAEVEATGARPVVADIESLDAGGWDDLLRGKDAVIWSAGAGGGNPQRTWAVDRDAAVASIDAAVRVGVPRYVMVSYFGAGPGHGVPEDDDFYAYAESKAQADEHLLGAAGSTQVTLVRPSALTDDETDGRIAVGEEKATQVSRATVARVIAAVVDRSDLGGVALAFNDGGQPIGAALDAAAARR